MVQSLQVVDLDFDTLRNDLIAFLRQNPVFKDYDFAGSSLSVLVELLAYNTQKNAFLTNMLFSEAFLDSGQLSASVFSHAKELNYTPRSARSAKASINVGFYATGESQPYIIQKGESFSSLVKNTQFVFTIPKTLIISSANNYYNFTTDIYEGVYVQDTYVYNVSEDIPYPTYRLTNKQADTTSLTVAVFEDGSTAGVPYTFKTSFLGLDNLSKVFFLQIDENGFYEIVFGDGVIGYKPKNNSTIILDYRITNSLAPNGAGSFVINFNPTGTSGELINGISNNPVITTTSIASGGAPQESIESVRYYAPRSFQTQERAIVPSDYETLLKTQFPEINAVNAYGGEDANPPQYGKVIVSIALTDFDTIPDSLETEYYNFLKSRCGLTTTPIFIDPEYTYIEVNSLVRYNYNITSNTSDRIKTLVTTAINNYNIDNLNDFNVILRYSNFTTTIDTSDISIISNITDILCYKKIPIKLNTASNYTINYNFALDNTIPIETYPHTTRDSTLSSSGFYYNGTYVSLEDDGNGNVNIVQYLNSNYLLVSQIGTIDYINGIVTLTNIIFDSFDGTDFLIYVRPKDKDIISQQNTILLIEPSAINLTIQPVTNM